MYSSGLLARIASCAYTATLRDQPPAATSGR